MKTTPNLATATRELIDAAKTARFYLTDEHAEPLDKAIAQAGAALRAEQAPDILINYVTPHRSMDTHEPSPLIAHMRAMDKISKGKP